MTKEKQFSFLSKDGKTKIHAVKWMPESGEYRAVLQITHGMVEYIERYKPFAEFLNDQGVLVVGHDHLGHGKSIQTEADLGYFDERKGNQYVIGDIYQLQEMTRKKKIGVLMSLHELDLAERVSDKIVCVKGENIEHYGTPEEVFTDGFVDQLYEITDGTFQEKSGFCFSNQLLLKFGQQAVEKAFRINNVRGGISIVSMVVN